MIREEYIIHFVLDGKGTYTSNGVTRSLSAGQMFLITPGEAHIYAADADDPWQYCWVGFNGIKAEAILNHCELSSENPVQEFHDPDTVLARINRILEVRQLTFSNDLRRKAELTELLSDLMDEHEHYHPRRKQSKYDYATNVYLASAIDFIKKGYQDGINVTDITDYVGISRTYLSQIFQKELGLSIQTFLIDYRLHKAANLLLSTSLSVSDVAVNVGYDDALAFSKAFKKKFGISPKNYRSQSQKMDRFTEKQK
jgi:AraC family transcriptional regulator of arabinose operon